MADDVTPQGDQRHEAEQAPDHFGLPEPEVGPVVSPMHGRRDNPDLLTRKPLVLWDRIKLLIFFSAAFLIIVWAQASANPLMTIGEAEKVAANTGIGQILLVLVIIEALRQIHFLLAEHVAGYHQMWLRLFARTERSTRPLQRLDALPRRARRSSGWSASSVLAWCSRRSSHARRSSRCSRCPPGSSAAADDPPARRSTCSSRWRSSSLIFWFLSRGGVDVYFPDDVEDPLRRRVGPGRRGRARAGEHASSSRTRRRSRRRAATSPAASCSGARPAPARRCWPRRSRARRASRYVFVDPGAFINMFFGVGVLKVKGLFRKLRKLSLRYGGVIVFFDEADTLGSRGGAVSQARVRRCRATRTPCDARTTPRATAALRLPRSQRCVAAQDLQRRQRELFVPDRRINGGGRHGRRHGHAAGAAHRDVGPEEAARLRQPRRTPHPRHAAEAAAEVPHPRA